MCQRLHTYSNSSLSFLSLNISHLRVKTTHMAKHNLDFLCSNRIKYRQPHSLILLFVFVSTVNSVLSQTPVTDCILQLSSPLNNSNCEASNWGGFINNCCSVVFDDYLDALGRRANQTGQIFLNSTEQNKCLNSMKIRDPSISDCGIEKLASGAGRCSDYAVTDVDTKLENRLKNFGEGCKLLNSHGTSSQACSDCLRGWEEIVAASDSGRESTKLEADVCRFAALVTLTSNKIDDTKWIDAVCGCLGGHVLSKDEAAGTASRSNKSRTGLSILIAGVVAVAVIVLVVTCILFRSRTKKRYPTRNNSTSQISTIISASTDTLSEDSTCHKLSAKEVYSETDNLSASNFIGQGIAGKVYKGVLSNGQRIAVKHIINDGHVETFVREVTSLSHVRHPNLVRLIGYCENHDEYFLVYELCHNGNLSEWLFGKAKVLSWIQRVEIAIDGARGLWFLHTYPEGCIVHRDIKPTNILIDANFRAKFSDFGLSKVMEVDQSHVSSEVRGTFGYVDPEYRKNHHVNASGDVYSFGVVLLQLLSGQRVINLDSKRTMSLNKMARFLARGGDITQLADRKLNGEYSVEGFELILKLALSCTGLKQQRPSMEQVVSGLEKAFEISKQVKSFTSPSLAFNRD